MKNFMAIMIFSLIFVISCGDDSEKNVITTSNTDVVTQKIINNNDYAPKTEQKVIIIEESSVSPASAVEEKTEERVEKTIIIEEEPKIFHSVIKDECLSVIGKKYDVDYRHIQKINDIKNANLIFPGQKLIIPIEKKVDSQKVVKTTKTVKKVSLKHATKKSDVVRLKGLRTYTEETIGHDKYKGTPEFAAFLLGIISKNEIANTKVILADEKPSHIQKEDIFMMTSGKNKVGEYKAGLRNNHLIAIHKAEVFVNGKFRGFVYLNKWCGNWIWRDELPPIKPLLTLLPPEEPLIPSEPGLIPIPEITVEEKPYRWDHELFVNIGGDTDFGRGNRGGFTGMEGAFYPWIFEGKNSTQEFGFGGKVNHWIGKNFEDFRYNGSYATIGPAGKYISHSGWDFGGKFLVGELWENGKSSDKKYKSDRDFGIYGTSLSFSHYQRELAGKKLFPETQLFGAMFFPFSKDVEHSWEGRKIEDISDLERFDHLMMIGGRSFLYQGDDIRPYLQGGYFEQRPTSRSLSLRLGASDINKLIFVGVGKNKDLETGKWSWAGEIGVDVKRVIDYTRDKQHKKQILEEFKNLPVE